MEDENRIMIRAATIQLKSQLDWLDGYTLYPKYKEVTNYEKLLHERIVEARDCAATLRRLSEML